MELKTERVTNKTEKKPVAFSTEDDSKLKPGYRKIKECHDWDELRADYENGNF